MIEPEGEKEQLSYCCKCENRTVVYAMAIYADPKAEEGVAHQHFSLCFTCGEETDLACPEEGV